MKARNWIILAALAAVTACSAMRHREEKDAETLQRYIDYADKPIDSFNYLGNFDRWISLGSSKLVVWTQINTAYLLTVREPCPDLPFAMNIGLTAGAGTVHRGFDAVQVGSDRCIITEIRPVNYKDLKAAERAGS